jgi:hypothetical protein
MGGDDDGRLRVLTVNVQNHEGDPQRIGVLNEVFRRINADLVALQEVLRTSARNQLDELLDGTGLHSTHQADVLAYSPPWADRYGGSAVAGVLQHAFPHHGAPVAHGHRLHMVVRDVDGGDGEVPLDPHHLGRICTRSLASRLDSGSSIKNTEGWRTMTRPWRPAAERIRLILKSSICECDSISRLHDVEGERSGEANQCSGLYGLMEVAACEPECT